MSNASDFAQITNENDVFSQVGDNERLSELVDQIRKASRGLPTEAEKEVLSLNEKLERHKEDPEKAAGVLRSIKGVCEGAAGNLTAQGILAAIASIL